MGLTDRVPRPLRALGGRLRLIAKRATNPTVLWGVVIVAVTRINDLWSFATITVPGFIRTITGLSLPDLGTVWSVASSVGTLVGLLFIAGGLWRASQPELTEQPAESTPKLGGGSASDAAPANALAADLTATSVQAPKPGTPNSLAMRPTTKRDPDHRLPPSLTNEPEDSPHKLDFRAERDKLIGRGLTLLDDLADVPTTAGHTVEQEWEKKITGYRFACRGHHERWWKGIKYGPAATAGTPLPPPPWRSSHRDRITAHLAWTVEYGWGCDVVVKVTSAEDTRDAHQEIRDLITDGNGYAERLRGLDLEVDDPEPTEGDVAQLLADAAEWVETARDVDAYWFPPAGLLGSNLVGDALRMVNIPVRQPIWRQQAVRAVEGQLAVLGSRL